MPEPPPAEPPVYPPAGPRWPPHPPTTWPPPWPPPPPRRRRPWLLVAIVAAVVALAVAVVVVRQGDDEPAATGATTTAPGGTDTTVGPTEVSGGGRLPQVTPPSGPPTTTDPGLGGAGVKVAVAIPAGARTLNPHRAAQPSEVLGAAVAVANQVWPSPFVHQPDGTWVMNETVLAAAEVTGTQPFTVRYELADTAMWSDGVAVGCADFLLAAVAIAGDEPSFSTGRVTTRVDNNPDTVVYEAIDDISCDGAAITVRFSRSVAEWRMLFSHLLPAHAIAAVAGVDDVEGALRSRDLDGLRPLSDVWDNGLGEGADPRLLVSAGPFVVTDVLKSGEVRLQRNERYGGTPAVLDGLVMRPFTDPSGLPSALARGDVQVAEFGPNLDILSQLQAAPSFEVVPLLRPSYVELGFVQEMFGGDPTVDDPAVRRAVALCVDREAILAELVHPFVPDAPLADSHLVAPDEPGYRPAAGRFATRDVSAARGELEGAGWVSGPDGVYVKNDVRLSLVMYHSTAARPARIAELVRDSCAEAGIEVALDLDAGGCCDHGSLRTQTWGPFNSVESNVSRFAVDGLLNNSGYANPDLAPLLDAVHASGGDPEALAAAAEAADAALWEEAASIPLYPGVYNTAWDVRLCGVVPNPTALGVTWNASTWRRCDPPPAGGGGEGDDPQP